MFTIIMDTYYRPALLKQAVGALFRQTYDNLEIILVNNGATEETVEYLHQVAASDKRVKLVHFEENQFSWADPVKMVNCWNAGLKVATGDYIWYQSDDDLIADDYAEKMVALFKGNPECTTAAGITIPIDASGQIRNVGPRTSNFRSRYMPGHLLALDVVRGGRTTFSAPGTIFTIRRDVLMKAGGFHRAITDSHLYGIVPFGVTGFDETALFYWRYHDGALNRHTTAWGHVGIDETNAFLKEWEVERRWQPFGRNVAKEVVGHIENQLCNTAAEWFVINLIMGRPRACWRIARKIWRRPGFWLHILAHSARQKLIMLPFWRLSKPLVRRVFSLIPSLARVSPKLASLREKAGR